MASRATSFGLAIAAAVVLTAAGVAARAAGADREPVRHVVRIDATSFEPRSLTVTAGDTVVWVNDDLYAHTATGKGGVFDSKDIAAGGSWSYVPKKAGLFGYTCLYHPTMKGTLRVR